MEVGPSALTSGSVAILKSLQEWNEAGIRVAILGRHVEQLFNELNLTPNLIAPHHRTCPFRIMFIASYP